MNNHSLTHVFLLVFFTFAIFFLKVPAVTAQSISVLGDIVASGKVSIKTSSGEWTPSEVTYPLLQNTSIMIDEGNVYVYFRDGSRAELSKDTLVSIDGYNSDYSMILEKGFMRYNVRPSTSLTVVTASTSNLIDNKKGTVPSIGCIWAKDRVTETKSTKGNILVDITGAGKTARLSSGKSIFIGDDANNKIYQPPANTCMEISAFLLLFSSGEKLARAGVIDLFTTTVILSKPFASSHGF
jgi:hypothetical protein